MGNGIRSTPVPYKVVIHPKPTATDADRGVTFYASINNAKDFKIGTCLYYKKEGRYGLSNYETFFPYSAAEYEDEYKFWAQFIDPTAYCESQRAFECVNSYDSAKFTFGAFQFAAHVPDGDFVQWTRAMLGLPDAKEHFPDLRVQNGRVQGLQNGSWVQLESKQSSQGLMDYFNANSAGIELPEAERTARMIHWARNSQSSRDLQVRVMLDTAVKLLGQVNSAVALTGQPDFICCAAMDIRHQGRGSVTAIAKAIKAGGGSDAILDRLLDIGDTNRNGQLRGQIKTKRKEGIFGKRKYDAGKKDFVPIKS
jgi:hypothetical protein